MILCDCLSITEGQVLLICATLNVKREKENHVHLEEQKVLSLYSRFKNEVIIKRNKKKRLDFFYWIWCFLKSGVNTTLNFDRFRWLRTLNSVVPKPEHICFTFVLKKGTTSLSILIFSISHPVYLKLDTVTLPWTWNIDAIYIYIYIKKSFRWIRQVLLKVWRQSNRIKLRLIS
jgi:hypothetical protein